MATKKALAKAFDAGQAAQRYGDPREVCPFAAADDAEEFDAWNEGYDALLAEKWVRPGGRPHLVNLSDQ